MMNEGAIGVFDSGVGGLSVWKAITALLPQESIIYFADQAHVPYGNRTRAEIEALTHAATAWLLRQGIKLVVLACNTASAAALVSLRRRWPELPIVGMEPAVKPASEHTHTGRVGVMATPGTLHAKRFQHLVERFASDVEVHTLTCPHLVEWVEAGQLAGPQVEAYLQKVLAPMRHNHIDQLVLGCTHYPFLIPAIRQALGSEVNIIDPAPAVARQVQRLLESRQLRTENTTPTYQFYTTGQSRTLRQQVQQLLGLAHPFVAETKGGYRLHATPIQS